MSKTALIIVDMLYDFTNPKGLVYYPQTEAIIPNIQVLSEACREAGSLIIYLQHRNRKGKRDNKILKMRPNCIEGTTGDTIDERLQVKEQDYVIPKRRYSGFYGTDLDLVLRENEIKNVIVAGAKTNCCIRATVTDAFYRDYNAIVVKECVATNSEEVNRVNLSDIDKYFGEVIDLETILARLKEGEM